MTDIHSMLKNLAERIGLLAEVQRAQIETQRELIAQMKEYIRVWKELGKETKRKRKRRKKEPQKTLHIIGTDETREGKPVR